MERIEGFVVDIACVRKWPQHKLQEYAAKHMTGCAEMGHCIESGYALVDGCAQLLDPAATPMVLRALRELGDEKGVRLRALRKSQDSEMVTVFVERAIPREPVESSTIRSAGWQDSILELEFASGIYQYLDVPRTVFEELMGADSQGRYFNNRIKSRFQSRKV